jgi:Helix-turn-helix domain/AraC-like ligand binding domain
MSEPLNVRWTFADCADTEIMGAEVAGHCFPEHFHETWSVGCIDSGTCCFRAAGKPFAASAGDVVVIPPYVVHTGGNGTGRLVYRMAYIGERWLASLSELVFGRTRVQFAGVVLHDPALTTQLSEALTPAPLPDVERKARLARALIALLARHGRTQILRNEIRPLSLENALDARSALHAVGPEAVSRSALIRRFTRTFGLSPSRYLRNLRCVSAKTLMREGMAIAQVAQELGFSDQAHFTREFKKIHGITPGRYRQAADRAAAQTA